MEAASELDSFRSVFKARAALKETCRISRLVVLEAWRKSVEDLKVDVPEVFGEDADFNHLHNNICHNILILP